MTTAQVQKIQRDFPDLFMEREVAEGIGKAKNTLARWRKEGRITPSHYTMSGSTVIWLYTSEDVKQAYKLAQTIRPGRRRKEVDGEDET